MLSGVDGEGLVWLSVFLLFWRLDSGFGVWSLAFVFFWVWDLISSGFYYLGSSVWNAVPGFWVLVST